jgi:hypothetical protein
MMDNTSDLIMAMADTVNDMTLSNPNENGVVLDANYLQNITVFACLMDGRWKKITISNPMNEGDLNFKGVQKAENEHALTFYAHFNPLDVTEKLWSIEEIPDGPTKRPSGTWMRSRRSPSVSR